MGLLDSSEATAMNNVAGVNRAAASILQMIQKHPGGLNGLINAFHSNGFGGLMNSWTSTAENLPVTGDQMQRVLGSEKVQELAQWLPVVIDKLSPNGTIPAQSNLLQLGESILASLGKTGT